MNPKRWLSLIVVVATSLASLTAYTEPYANWYDTSRLSQKNKSLALQFRTSRDFHTPQRDEVPFPRYPDAALFIGNVTRTQSAFVSLQLVSKSPIGKVVNWYQHRMPDLVAVKISHWAVKGFLLTKGRKTLELQEHADWWPSAEPYILVLKIPTHVKPLTIGYRTIIEIRYKPRVPVREGTKP